jgi:hypothetical protein
MESITLEIKNTEGKKTKVKLKVTNPLSCALREGLSYRFGHLVKKAKGADLTDDELKESPALAEMSSETALEIVEENFRGGSDLLEEDAEAAEKAKVEAEAAEKAKAEAEAAEKAKAEAEAAEKAKAEAEAAENQQVTKAKK